MNSGDIVYFKKGNHKGKFGRYKFHGIDGGYIVPFVDIGGDFLVKPWDNEIVSLNDIQQEKDRLLERLDEIKKLQCDMFKAYEVSETPPYIEDCNILKWINSIK